MAFGFRKRDKDRMRFCSGFVIFASPALFAIRNALSPVAGPGRAGLSACRTGAECTLRCRRPCRRCGGASEEHIKQHITPPRKTGRGNAAGIRKKSYYARCWRRCLSCGFCRRAFFRCERWKIISVTTNASRAKAIMIKINVAI